MSATSHKEPLALFFRPKTEIRTRHETPKHVEGFSNLLKYLVRLRREGTLDDDDFGEVVRIASAAFIESEVTEKVERVLESKVPNDVLLRLWK